MAQYINKAAVKAWIKEKKIPFKKDIDDGVYPTYLCALMDFEDFVDTLEVKEGDLEKENLPISNSLTKEGLFTFEDGSQAIITKTN